MAGQVITYSHDGGSNLYGAFACGTVLADDTTPIDVKVICGFRPAAIVLINQDTAVKTEWYKGMDEDVDDEPIIANKDAGRFTIDPLAAGVNAYAATGGPYYYDGIPAVNSTPGEVGFILPATLQAAGDTISWIAYR